MKRQKLTFALTTDNAKLKRVLNKDFLEIEIYAISEGMVGNDCFFTLESMEKSLPTFYNKFILGYFNCFGNVNNFGKFEEHNSDIKIDLDTEEEYPSYLSYNAEKAIGLIRESDLVEIVSYKGKKWIHLTAAILVKYNREAVKHLLKNTKTQQVSVEISVTKSHDDEDGITIIEDFVLDGITLLGTYKNSNIEAQAGIQGAHLLIKDFKNSQDYEKEEENLQFAYQRWFSQQEDVTNNEQISEILMEDNTKKEICIDIEENGGINLENIENNSTEILNNETVSVEETENKVAFVEEAPVASEKVVCEDTETQDFSENKIEEETKEDTEEKKECGEAFVENSENKEFTETSKNNEELIFANDKDKANTEESNLVKEGVNGETFSENKTKEENCAECPVEIEEEKKEEESCDVTEETMEGVPAQEEPTTENFVTNEEVEPVTVAFSTVIEGITFSGEELVDKYLELKEEYEELEEKYEKAKKILEELEDKHLKEYGEKVFKANADEISGEAMEEVRKGFYAECDKRAFSSEEEVKNYIENKVAFALYTETKAQKEAQKETQKEFSAKIITTKTTAIEDEDSLEKLKKLLKL